MKIGLLGCGRDCSDYFDQVLKPWLEYKEKHGNIVISLVTAQFQEAAAIDLNKADNSRELMEKAFEDRRIDFLATPELAVDEKDARNIALRPLLEQKADIVWLLDFDEVYTLEEIEKILWFVEQDKYTPCFKIQFKNYTFTEKTYTDFAPRRIWRTQINELSLHTFVYDNDAKYTNVKGEIVFDHEISVFQIPAALANPKHFTWLDNERSHNKVLYQEKHFAHGAGCGFKWEDGHLAFNKEYFKKTGESIPVLHNEKPKE